MELNLPKNSLHTEPQSFQLNKLATLIGENGSGKSSILKSIFDLGLKEKGFDNHKLVCFSSGQNENYSKLFGNFLTAERNAKRDLTLDCFYYDKSWSKLVIFLATVTKPSGFVRHFLKKNNYVEIAPEFDEDLSTKLTLKVKVDSAYVSRVKMAIEDEIKGDANTLVSSAYHRTLESFINTNVSKEFDFEEPLTITSLSLESSDIKNVSYEEDEAALYDPIITFFTQAADNDYFIVRESLQLNFTKNVELDAMSDGEYQLLFLYSLIDLLDSETTLFLLDEADSHLHYKNLEHFWLTLKAIKGKAITTTHLLDSITNTGIDNIKIVNSGIIYSPHQSDELVKRFETLSNIQEAKLKVYSLYEKVVLMDNENDWEIFKLLIKRKLGINKEELCIIEDNLKQFAIVGKESGWDTHTSTLAKSKNMWVENYKSFINGYHSKTKNVFLLCDRDNLPLSSIGNKTSPLLVNDSGFNKFENGAPFQTYVMAWKRREIKHYLLSFSALATEVDKLNNSETLIRPSYLYANSNGDCLIKQHDGNLFSSLLEKEEGPKKKKVKYLVQEYNDALAMLPSDTVKPIVANFIEKLDVEPLGFNLEMATSYVNNIPPQEISDDIAIMYRFLIGVK